LVSTTNILGFFFLQVNRPANPHPRALPAFYFIRYLSLKYQDKENRPESEPVRGLHPR